jgi:hypothetical protein
MLKPWDVLAILMYGLVAALAALAAETTNSLDVVLWAIFGVGAALFLAGLFKRVFATRVMPSDVAEIGQVDARRLTAAMAVGFVLAGASGALLTIV